MSSRTEQEEKLEVIFGFLETAFKKLDKLKDDAKRPAALKDITAKLRDAKALIKEFEREARIDGLPARELADRKRTLVNELNSFIALKKNYSSAEEARGELMAGAGGGEGGTGGGSGGDRGGGVGGGANPYDGMTMQELMREGRRGMQETETALGRSEKLVEDTLQIGAQTAATLHDQTQQLNKVVDDLNEIEFTVKKASRVIADITKGVMTDRCIMFLLFLVVAGVIALVVVKVVLPNKSSITSAANNLGINTTQITDQISAGLTTAAQQVAAGLNSTVTAVTRGINGMGGGSGAGHAVVGGSGGGVSSSNSSGSAGGSTRRRLFQQMLYGHLAAAAEAATHQNAAPLTLL